MAGEHADQSLWENERAKLATLRESQPDLFVLDPERKGNVLKKVGIAAVPADLPPGYIRYSPTDFIVEEIATDGTLVEAVTEPQNGPVREGEGTIHADMVKIGISTLDAVERVASGLGLTVDKVRYAGIKDAVAITAQRISMRGASLDAALSLNLPQVLLKNISNGKGALNVGDLQGNRFTLFIRTNSAFNEAKFNARLALLEQDGARNYYGTQRFGSPRFLAHYFGMLLHKGDHAGLAFAFLTTPSPTEIPLVAGLRGESAAFWGDWNKMRETLGVLAYTFRFELMLLDGLIKADGQPDMYLRGATAIPSAQTNLWVKAYASYLANRVMSDTPSNLLPATIPLLSGEPDSKRLYAPYLAVDGTEDFQAQLRKSPFIISSRTPTLETLIRPKVHGAAVQPEGVALSFDLPKGAYATTILMNLFDATTGYPLPEWIQPTDYDTKILLGTGTMEQARTQFAESIAAVAAKKSEGEGGE